MNRRAMWWAAACAALGLVMMILGIHDALDFHAPNNDDHQSLTLGQAVDMITAAGLLIIAALIVIGQVRAKRRHTKHRRWVREHQNLL